MDSLIAAAHMGRDRGNAVCSVCGRLSLVCEPIIHPESSSMVPSKNWRGLVSCLCTPDPCVHSAGNKHIYGPWQAWCLTDKSQIACVDWVMRAQHTSACVTGVSMQPLEPCVVVACGALPHDLHLPSLPCLMVRLCMAACSRLRSTFLHHALIVPCHCHTFPSQGSYTALCHFTVLLIRMQRRISYVVNVDPCRRC